MNIMTQETECISYMRKKQHSPLPLPAATATLLGYLETWPVYLCIGVWPSKLSAEAQTANLLPHRSTDLSMATVTIENSLGRDLQAYSGIYLSKYTSTYEWMMQVTTESP